MTTGRKNGKSTLVSVRLPFELLESLKKIADKLGRPYQALMKDAIQHGLPIVKEVGATEVKLRREAKAYRALHVDAAVEKLKKARAKSA
jgi:predicted DNA-binding protein